MSKTSSVGDLRPSKSADPLPLFLTSKLQEGILLKVSQASDTSLSPSTRKSPLHKQRSQEEDETKNFLALPGEDERSNRRHSVQVSGSRHKSKHHHSRKGSYPETELLRPKDAHLLKPYGHHSMSPSPDGSVIDCSRRRSSSRDSRDLHSPSRRSSNSSGGHSRRSSRAENGDTSRHHHHGHHHSGSTGYHSGHHSRRESSISNCGDRRSRVGSTASCSASRIVDLKRNSCVNSVSGAGSRKGGEFDDDADSVTQRRRKIIIMIIGSAFVFILLTSVLLVAVTLTLSPKIDELVRKENEETQIMLGPKTSARPMDGSNRTLLTTVSSGGHPDG